MGESQEVQPDTLHSIMLVNVITCAMVLSSAIVTHCFTLSSPQWCFHTTLYIDVLNHNV